MKFGACIWPFNWDAPYEEGIRRIAGLGFKAVELIAWNRELLTCRESAKRLASTLKNKLCEEGKIETSGEKGISTHAC